MYQLPIEWRAKLYDKIIVNPTSYKATPGGWPIGYA
jgi:hypothetical protein